MTDEIARRMEQKIEEQKDHIRQLQATLAAREASHCKDCCCARSWKALGVTEYTGKSIDEHIEQLVQQRDAAVQEAGRLRSVLKKIAKPALGGKQQQWMAQEALREPT